MEIGEIIKAHRKKRSLTLVQLASKTGIDQGNLSRIEQGKQSLTNETMTLLAQAFNISLPELFSAEKYAPNTNPSIIDNNKHTNAGEITYRPVKSFKRLKDIPPGESVLVDGITAVPNAGEDGKKWKVDEKTQFPFIGDAARGLASHPANLVAMEVPDDTMTPRLFKGDCVLIDSSDTDVPSTGGVFAVAIDDRPLEVRRLFPRAGNGLVIVCDNNQYPPLNLTAAETAFVSVIGRIKASLGKSGF
jgi:transcriptional regulator with XRE-family HTH domain